MEQENSRGITVLITPEGKITHRVIGKLTEAETLGILFYLTNFSHNQTQLLVKASLEAITHFGKSLESFVEEVQKLAEKEREPSCQQGLFSDSSPL